MTACSPSPIPRRRRMSRRRSIRAPSRSSPPNWSRPWRARRRTSASNSSGSAILPSSPRTAPAAAPCSTARLRSGTPGPRRRAPRLDPRGRLRHFEGVKQSVVTLDLEGVLVPEIWIAVAERTGIAELRRTTRDEPDYDKLMRDRLVILERHGITLPRIQEVIGGLRPLPGGVEFLRTLREATQVI